MTKFRDAAPLALTSEGVPTGHFDVTPSNTVDFTTRPRSLWIGTGGDIVVVDENDVVLTYTVPDAYELPGAWKRVNATGTTASQIRGWY